MKEECLTTTSPANRFTNQKIGKRLPVRRIPLHPATVSVHRAQDVEEEEERQARGRNM